MEDGIASSGTMIVRSVDDDGTFITYDKTWQEVTNALKNGISVYILKIEEIEEIEGESFESTFLTPIVGSDINIVNSSLYGALPYRIYYISTTNYPNISIGRL